MINELAHEITSYIEKNSDIENTDALEKINYALQAILSETFKIIVLVIIFSILGKLNYFFFSLLILFSIRTFAGGYHCNTTLSCLLCSTIFFLFTSFMGPALPKLYILIYYIIGVLNIFIVIFNAPFPNKKRPIKNKKRRLILNIISTFLVILWTSILLFYIKDISYLNCGFLTITLEIFQVIPTRKEYCNEK